MAQHEIIKSLSAKISRLVEENSRLQEEYDALSGQRDKLRKENRELKETVAALEKRVKVLELGGSLSGGGDTKVAKARINRLMREIDRCIALMNR